MARKGKSISQNTNDRSPIVVCSTTKEYRFQVHSVCRPSDCVLEVGSAHGVTCKLISGRTKDVVGIDIQETLVEESRRKFPGLHFYQQDASNIKNFLKDILPNGCPKFSVVFVDIAGTIEMKTLLPILDGIERAVRPRILVVKSLNYSKLLIQLLKGYQIKATQVSKMELANCLTNDSPAEGRLIQIDNLAQATRNYLEHCKIQYTRLISTPCPFPRTWDGEKSSNRRAELCHMNRKSNFCRVIPSIIKSSGTVVLVFLPLGISFRAALLDGVAIEHGIRRLKSGEISRKMSRSIMQTYRNFFLCPPFLKNTPILICDQIKKSTPTGECLYFEATLGEYISVRLCDLLCNEGLCIVTNKMLLNEIHETDKKSQFVLHKARPKAIVSLVTLLFFSCCT